MEDFEAMAVRAVSYIAAYATDTAEAAMSATKAAIGKKVAEWVEKKFAGTTEAAAVEKLREDPRSPGKRKQAEGAIQGALESEPHLLTELAELLKSAGAQDNPVRQTASAGDNSSVVQIAGDRNTVNKP